MSWSVKSYPVYEEVPYKNVDRCSGSGPVE